MRDGLIKLWREQRGFALFVVLMIVVRSALADWNTVPTGSMKPTVVLSLDYDRYYLPSAGRYFHAVTSG